MDLQVLLGRADVDPVAAVHGPEDAVAAGEEGGEEAPLDRVVDALGHELEDAGLEHVDAGVDRVRGDLLGPGLLEEAKDAAPGVGLDEAVRRRVRHGGEQDRGRGALGVVAGHDVADVNVGEDVAVQHDRPLVEEGQRVADGPPGPERGVLDGVADVDAEGRPVAEDRFDPLRAVCDGEDHLPYPRPGQQVELVPEERAVDHGHDGLRCREGEGAQARSLTAGEDDRSHGPGRRIIAPPRRARLPTVPNGSLTAGGASTISPRVEPARPRVEPAERAHRPAHLPRPAARGGAPDAFRGARLLRGRDLRPGRAHGLPGRVLRAPEERGDPPGDPPRPPRRQAPDRGRVPLSRGDGRWCRPGS